MSNTIYENNYNEFIEKHNIDLSQLKRDYIKNPLNKGEKPHKEDLEYLYIELNLSVKEISERCITNKTPTSINRYLKFNNIIKSKELIREKYKQTNMERYGVENASQSEEVKEKYKQTMLKKYGVESPLQNKDIKERVKQTNMERYGGVAPSCSEEVKEKMKQTIVKRYGVEYASQSEEIREKKKQTMVERYGVEHALQSEEIKEKMKQTNLEKYGVEYVSQLPEFIEKMKQTNLEKYGNEYTLQSEKIREKAKQTNLEKYGVENYTQTIEYNEKTKQTCLERYGVENPSQSEEIKEKKKQTSFKNNGVEYALQSDEYKEKMKQTNKEKYGVEYYTQKHISEEAIDVLNNKDKLIKIFEDNNTKSRRIIADKLGVEVTTIGVYLKKYELTNEYKLTESIDPLIEDILINKDKLIKFFEDNNTKSRRIIADKLGVGITTVNTYLKKHNLLDEYNTSGCPSSYEEDIVNKIREFYDGEILTNQLILNGKEIDIYIPEHNLGIEFNGDFWHSERKLLEKTDKPQLYHYEKSMVARDKGIFLLHIFEYEYGEKIDKFINYIKQLMELNCRIFVENCIINQVDIPDYKKFIEDNSLQEIDTPYIRSGLYHNNELVEVISFNELGNNEYELSHHCFKQGINVINGINKLFKHFINTYNPNKVTGYNNIHNQRPDIYNQLNFKYSHTTDPTCVYVNNSKKIESLSPNELTNKKHNKLYDCGKDVYVWNKE